MELSLYFNPVDFGKFRTPEWIQPKHTLGNLLEKNREKVKPEKAKLVIIGVEEDRNAAVKGSSKAPDKIREHLYLLNRISPRLKLIDLGNLRKGKTVNDTYFALRDVCEAFVSAGQTVIILGGSQDLTLGIGKSFSSSKSFQLACVDPKPDIKKGARSVNSENYLGMMLEKQPNLSSCFVLGYQNYYTDSLDLDYLNQHYSETRRLGQLRYDLPNIEPLLRDSTILSFDLNAVRAQDAPGQYFLSPNGLYTEEACQIARYAGYADHLKVAGFFNLIPKTDTNDLSSKLMAQAVWHFIEGFNNRMVEDPRRHPEQFSHYIVDIEDIDTQMIFYQSQKTGRWWMETHDEENEQNNLLVPCNENDYLTATKNEIPDCWWKNLRKLNKT